MSGVFVGPVSNFIVKPYGRGRKAYVLQYTGTEWVFSGWMPSLGTTIELQAGQALVYARRRGDVLRKLDRLDPPKTFIPATEGVMVGAAHRRVKPPRPQKRSRVRAHQRYKAGQRKARRAVEIWSGPGQGVEYWPDGEQCLR